MNKQVWLLFSIFFIASCASENPILINQDAFPQDKETYQKRIVAQLSGATQLADGSLLGARWSEEERKKSASYLKNLLLTVGIDPIEHHYRSPNLNPAIDLILEPFKGTNIYGILPSTSKSKEYVILGAHYDSGKRNAPGAIDNATGIALIYSVVKELAAQKERSKNSVIVFFDQEEEELIGSKAFAQLLLEMEWKIHSVHCFDMVGWDEDKDLAMETFSGSESLSNLYNKVAMKQKKSLKQIMINPEGHTKNSTDFDSFVRAGYPTIGAGECYYHRDSTPFKDTPADTYETVDFDYLLSCTEIIEEIIKEIVLP